MYEVWYAVGGWGWKDGPEEQEEPHGGGVLVGVADSARDAVELMVIYGPPLAREHGRGEMVCLDAERGRRVGRNVRVDPYVLAARAIDAPGAVA